MNITYNTCIITNYNYKIILDFVKAYKETV